MKTRIIVAVIAVPILFAIILFAPVWALGAMVGVIAACCAWEFLRCADKTVDRRSLCYAAAAGFAIPLATSLGVGLSGLCAIVFALFAALFCEIMLSFRNGEPKNIEIVMNGLVAGAVMPLLISGIVRLGLRDNGRALVLLPFLIAFSCDSGAYFAGSFLGKHKMTPHLSPHKTIEGAAGGFLSAIVILIIYGLVLKAMHFEVKLAVMAAYGLLGALACELGDLGFSAVKRLRGVKDYGTLIPGHGGMLDRFDSMFWTAAMTEALVTWVCAISK